LESFWNGKCCYTYLMVILSRYFKSILYIQWLYGILVVIWYISVRFGILYFAKS
jgi:hypothetical protein